MQEKHPAGKGEIAMQSWKELESLCQSCNRCPLCTTRTHVVFGDGDCHSPVLFIGEGPGEQEDLQGKPFVGPAGQLLTSMLSVIDLSRTKVYITNVIKCRPPKNRDPLQQEQDACLPLLWSQVNLIQPKIIVCLGRIAATCIIDKDFRISRQHGEWTERDGIHMTALYHPSALLRDPGKRPDTFLDLKSLQAKIQALCPDILSPLR